MTAQEKAKELLNKFRPWADRGIQDSEGNEIESAKQCALIAVEQIVAILQKSGNEYWSPQYWQDVKDEIEKL